MNKKFTMMLAAFMAAGYTITVEANVVKFENPEKGVVSYALKADIAANELTDKFMNGKSYVNLTVKADQSTYLYLTDEDGSIKLQNFSKLGKEIFWTYDSNSKTIKSAIDNPTVLAIGNYSQFKIELVSSYSFKLKTLDDTKYIGNEDGTLTLVDDDNAVTFEVSEGATSVINAITFNKEVDGAFSITYTIDEEVAEGNPFQDVTAIEVIAGADNSKYPAGTYFVVDAPASLDIYSTFNDSKELDKLTFVTISPTDKYSEISNTVAGVGMKFVQKKGSDMVAYAASVKAGKFTTNNACFQIVRSVLSTEEVKFVAPSIYVNKSDNSALVNSTNIIVTAVSAAEKLFVTTAMSNSNFDSKEEWAKMGDIENIVTADKFLSSSDAKIFNIQFLSKKLSTSTTDEKEFSKSEYLKYLTIGEDGATTLAGSTYVDLGATQSQWIVTDMADDKATFSNLENGASFSAELVKTENENEYKLASVTGFGDNVDIIYLTSEGEKATVNDKNVSANMIIKLTPVTFDASAGYVSDELDNVGLTKLSFSVDNNYTSDELFLNTVFKADGSIDKIELNNEKSSLYEIVKITGEDSTLDEEVAYAIWKDNKVNKDKKVKKSLNQFAIKIYGTENEEGEANYLEMNFDGNVFKASADKSELDGANTFVIKKNVNGSYSLVPAGTKYEETIKNGAETFDLNAQGNIESESIYAELDAKFNIAADKLNESLEAKSQHVTLSSSNTYMAVGEEGKAIMAATSELKAEYTKEDVTFWIDTVNADAYVPTFYISKGSKQFLFNAADSVNVLDEGTGSYITNKDMLLSDNATPRAIFRAGELKDKNQTLATTINGEAKDLKAEEGIEAYQYTITLKDEAVEGEYIVKSVADNKYLYRLNGELGFKAAPEAALVLTITTAEAPTSNEAVTASEVKVVAQDGAVVVKNAAGKNVVVSTILGQVVANEVLTSDNATINVPAGIVVVAVEGESFKVNVK